MNGRRGSVTSTSRRTGLFGTSTPHVRARSPERPPAALTTASALTSSPDRKSTRLNSSHLVISYAVFCLKKKKQKQTIKIFDKHKKYHHLNRPIHLHTIMQIRLTHEQSLRLLLRILHYDITNICCCYFLF